MRDAVRPCKGRAKGYIAISAIKVLLRLEPGRSKTVCLAKTELASGSFKNLSAPVCLAKGYIAISAIKVLLRLVSVS
eukprot:4215495-Lingulodinium_polyedra.AAC.1